jgi:hypothetical protein
MFHCVIHNAHRGRIVAVNRCWRLWVIFSRVSQNILACLQFKNNPQSSASAVDATTNLNIAHKVKNSPFNLIGCVGLGFHPMKKCPHAQLCVFASNKYDALERICNIISDA